MSNKINFCFIDIEPNELDRLKALYKGEHRKRLGIYKGKHNSTQAASIPGKGSYLLCLFVFLSCSHVFLDGLVALSMHSWELFWSV